MVFRYHLFRLFFWGVSSIIGIGLARTVLFPLIIALFSGASTFVIATTGATSRVVFGRFSQFLGYNPQIQISAESETKRSIFREKDKTKRSKKESAQHSKSRNKSFVMTSVSAL